MPFGLCNATSIFQRLMAQALTSVTKKYGNLVMCYVDDLVIATPTLEDHIERLDQVFAYMKRAGLKHKSSKCEILKASIKYPGRMVDKYGIRPDPDAVEAVPTWKSPKYEHKLMSFLSFANYYREFLKGYADKVYPMQQLMRRKGKNLTWNNAAEESFQRIKKELSEAPVLCMSKRCGPDLWYTPSRIGMEREDCRETDSLRKQSLEGHGKERRGTQSRDVRGSHLCGKVQGVSGQ